MNLSKALARLVLVFVGIAGTPTLAHALAVMCYDRLEPWASLFGPTRWDTVHSTCADWIITDPSRNVVCIDLPTISSTVTPNSFYSQNPLLNASAIIGEAGGSTVIVNQQGIVFAIRPAVGGPVAPRIYAALPSSPFDLGDGDLIAVVENGEVADHGWSPILSPSTAITCSSGDFCLNYSATAGGTGAGTSIIASQTYPINVSSLTFSAIASTPSASTSIPVFPIPVLWTGGAIGLVVSLGSVLRAYFRRNSVSQ